MQPEVDSSITSLPSSVQREGRGDQYEDSVPKVGSNN